MWWMSMILYEDRWVDVRVSVYDYFCKYKEDERIRLVKNTENKRMVTVLVQNKNIHLIEDEHQGLRSLF